MKKVVGFCVLSACIALPMAVQAKNLCLLQDGGTGAYLKLVGVKSTGKQAAASSLTGWLYSSAWAGAMPVVGSVVGRGNGVSVLAISADGVPAGFPQVSRIVGSSVDSKTLAGNVNWIYEASNDTYLFNAVSCKEADAYMKDNL